MVCSLFACLIQLFITIHCHTLNLFDLGLRCSFVCNVVLEISKVVIC